MQPAGNRDTMSRRTTTVTATHRCERLPDLATIEAVAIGEGESAAGARAAASDLATNVRESLTAVSSERVVTVEIQVEETDRMFDPAVDAAYQATERLRIDCVPETAEDVVVEATDAGGSVPTIEFELHEDVRRQLQDEALAGAVERARAKAERLAAAEETTVGEAVEITTDEGGSGTDGLVDEALAMNEDDGLQPTPVTVSETVEVVFELGD